MRQDRMNRTRARALPPLRLGLPHTESAGRLLAHLLLAGPVLAILGLVVPAVAILGLAGCGGFQPATTPTPVPTPTPPLWSPPVFEGDGLPEGDDAPHETGDTTNQGDDDDGGETTPTPAVEELTILTGLFSWTLSDDGSYTGYLLLMEISAGCYDVFGPPAVTPDGLKFSVYPLDPPDLQTPPTWPGMYSVCGSRPCMSGAVVEAGQSTALEDSAWLEIASLDDHYLTVAWSSSSSSGANLTFYNCGERQNWSY